MYNNSSILLFLKGKHLVGKSKNEKDYNMIWGWICFVVSILLFGLLCEWNKVYTYNDDIALEGKLFIPDSLFHIDLTVSNTYWSLMHSKDTINSGMHIEMRTDALAEKFIKTNAIHSSVVDSAFNVVKKNNVVSCSDSLYALFSVGIKKAMFRNIPRGIFGVKGVESSRFIDENDNFSFSSQSELNKDNVHHIVFNSTFGLKYANDSQKGQTNISDCSVCVKPGMNSLVGLEDFSQGYYRLNIRTNLEHNIDKLNINFNGATSFANIDPIPDRMTPISIHYVDKNKISEILKNGLLVYHKNEETIGLQGLRVYLLSTILTLTIGYTIKCFSLLFWDITRIRRRKCTAFWKKYIIRRVNRFFRRK